MFNFEDIVTARLHIIYLVALLPHEAYLHLVMELLGSERVRKRKWDKSRRDDASETYCRCGG